MLDNGLASVRGSDGAWLRTVAGGGWGVADRLSEGWVGVGVGVGGSMRHSEEQTVNNMRLIYCALT